MTQYTDKKCDACGRVESLPVPKQPEAYPYRIESVKEPKFNDCHRVRRTKCWLCPPCVKSIVGDEVARHKELRRQTERKCERLIKESAEMRERIQKWEIPL